MILDGLPVPPVQQVGNLFLLLGIVKKVQYALVEALRVRRGVRPTED
jgi:hypothetical protein